MSAVVDARRTLVSREAATELDLGQIGSWRLTRLVSQGRLCQVYQAAPVTGFTRAGVYAIKVLGREHEEDPDAIACLQREALLGRDVSHANLVAHLSAHTDHAPYYVVMPWLMGNTLAENLKAGPISPCIAVWIARQVAEALEALHHAGWTHGDIKPANILVSRQRHATLLDLGFAHHRDMPSLAGRQYLAGSVAYMAPERFENRLHGDIRSDIYSLGVTLYEMLAGKRPFEDISVAEVIRQHRSSRPSSLRCCLPHLPREAAALIDQMLAKEPLRRPHTPRELVDRLVRLEITLLAER